MEGICGVLPHHSQRVIKGQVLLSLMTVQSQDQLVDGISPFKLNGISIVYTSKNILELLVYTINSSYSTRHNILTHFMVQNIRIDITYL